LSGQLVDQLAGLGFGQLQRPPLLPKCDHLWTHLLERDVGRFLLRRPEEDVAHVRLDRRNLLRPVQRLIDAKGQVREREHPELAHPHGGHVELLDLLPDLVLGHLEAIHQRRGADLEAILGRQRGQVQPARIGDVGRLSHTFHVVITAVFLPIGFDRRHDLRHRLLAGFFRDRPGQSQHDLFANLAQGLELRLGRRLGGRFCRLVWRGTRLSRRCRGCCCWFVFRSIFGRFLSGFFCGRRLISLWFVGWRRSFGRFA